MAPSQSYFNEPVRQKLSAEAFAGRIDGHRRFLKRQGGRRGDFRFCDLAHADLSGLALADADFTGAKLLGARLIGTGLQGANLYGADLRQAHLLKAVLDRADLRGACLHGAALSEASLIEADLREGMIVTPDRDGSLTPIGFDVSTTEMTAAKARGILWRSIQAVKGVSKTAIKPANTTGTNTLRATAILPRGFGRSPRVIAPKISAEGATIIRVVCRPIGVIAVDSIFTPILNVKYTVNPARVGEKIDYERLMLEINTDGSVEAEDAMAQGAMILRDHVNLFIQMDTEPQPTVEEKEVDAEVQRIRELLAQPVDELDLSVRAHNCLKAANIKNIGDLVRREESEMLKFRNFGRKSLQELIQVLDERGLFFGMDVDKYLETSS